MSEQKHIITISNVVATALVSTKINLPEFSWRFKAEYVPSSFAAAQCRVQNPVSTALIFNSGRIVSTGSTSESSALVSIHLYVRMIRSIEPAAKIKSIVIQNLVASADLRSTIDLQKLDEEYCLSSILDVSLFPGLRLKLPDSKVKVLVFLKGKIVLTGARTRSDLIEAYKSAYEIISPFFTNGDAKHADLQTSKHSAKKRRVELSEITVKPADEAEAEIDGEDFAEFVEAADMDM